MAGGQFEYLGTIVATTAKNQSDTAAPFTIPTQSRICIQSDTAVCIRTDATATVATGLQVDAGEKFEFAMGVRETLLSCIAVSGTSNVKVYRVYPQG